MNRATRFPRGEAELCPRRPSKLPNNLRGIDATICQTLYEAPGALPLNQVGAVPLVYRRASVDELT